MMNDSVNKIYLDSATLILENMVSRHLFLLGLFVLVQLANGGWIARQVEKYVSPLLHPITEANEKLKATIDEIETKKQEFKAQNKELIEKVDKIPKECQDELLQKNVKMFENWDFDSCVNLTDDMKTASDLAMQGGIYTINITEIVNELGKNILDCTNGNYSDIFPCYNKNLRTMKTKMEDFKTNTVPIVHEAVIVGRTMRIDFDHCIGIPVTLRNQIEKQIENIKC
ncbi:uncharacterized protein [Halyomorpha halys]|uniref:uncharacterized protein n=1 Tax=Halyomorpha halys TaxID=286706 RepID=UPI0006D514DE|nr:uncharacterized protein LOC106685533 [Halyomorpha halys]